jgi:cyanophycin synthetase
MGETRMELQRVWVLRGPNLWARCTVLEVELVLNEETGRASGQIPGFHQRLLGWLPGLAPRRRTDGGTGDFARQLRDGTGLAYVLPHVGLELQSLAGSPVSFDRVRATNRPDLFRVVLEYEEETLGRACLDAARDLCVATVNDQPFDLPSSLRELRDLAHDVRLGPSTAAIVRAARARNIPVRRLNRGSLVQLGHGAFQRRICTAETDRTSAIAETIAQDKELTRSLLRGVGVPVPEGRPVADAEDAWRAAEELGPPVVVKPRYGNHGRGVTTNLTTREQVFRAFEAAREEGSEVMVERFAPGSDYRLLVVGDKLVAAALREPAQVVGDGRSTVAELVAEVNKDPRRSDGHATVLSWIKLDPVSLAVLAEQGYTPASVPAAGSPVLIRRNGNLSTGGTATDVTDRVHPEVASRAVEAARAVGLDIAGVDVVATDISLPLEPQRAAVVEVNAGPGLRMHLEPSAGKPRPVGEAIVSLLFPEGETGRIPVVAVTGVNGKTTTTRLIAHLLREAGAVVGMTSTDGTFIAGRRTEARDCSGPRSARAVLLHPQVTAAVLETARGGILREGLGFDQCDVAVVTNIGGGDHLSLRGIDTPEDLARVKRTVVEAVAPPSPYPLSPGGGEGRVRGGTAVLNADDPLVAAMAGHCPGKVAFFSRGDRNSVVAAHRSAGGRSAFIRDAALILAEGEREQVLLPLAQVPLTHQGRVGFQVENALAGAAAAWALDLPLDTIRAGLAGFTGDVRQVPGRFNLFDYHGAVVIVDYAHNPSALAALVAALDQFPHRRRLLVYSGCNRRDDDIVGMGQVAGDGFDAVLLYEDRGNNDRADGELNRLLRRGLAAGKRVASTVEVRSELEAIANGLRDLRPGDLLVIGVETIEEALAFVQDRLNRLPDRGGVERTAVGSAG